MSYMFTISPDFGPERLSGWYIFNTWLQKQTELAIHLEPYSSFASQREAVQQDKIDLIYANAFDTAMLVREKGFKPLAKAEGESDEAIIAVPIDHPAQDVADLPTGTRIALTSDPDVRMMGMIMLEPGDLDAHNTQMLLVESYPLVAKQLIKGDADVGIFLAKAYDELSSLVKKQLRILVRSQISVIHHAMMISPNMSDHADLVRKALLDMHQCEKGRGVLSSMGFQSWQAVDQEQMEFMIDLMDTLNT